MFGSCFRTRAVILVSDFCVSLLNYTLAVYQPVELHHWLNDSLLSYIPGCVSLLSYIPGCVSLLSYIPGCQSAELYPWLSAC